MNPETTKQLISANRAKNGGILKCYLCPKELDEQKRMSWVIEHKDNNRKNNDLRNLDIACRACNRKKNGSLITNHLKVKEISLSGEGVSVCSSAWDLLRDKAQAQSSEFKKGEVTKPLFTKWFYDKMLTVNTMSVEYAVSNGARRAGVSPDTARNRYLRVLVCEESYCTVTKDKMIVWQKNGRLRFLKEEYEPLFKKYK